MSDVKGKWELVFLRPFKSRNDGDVYLIIRVSCCRQQSDFPHFDVSLQEEKSKKETQYFLINQAAAESRAAPAEV